MINNPSLISENTNKHTTNVLKAGFFIFNILPWCVFRRESLYFPYSRAYLWLIACFWNMTFLSYHTCGSVLGPHKQFNRVFFILHIFFLQLNTFVCTIYTFPRKIYAFFCKTFALFLFKNPLNPHDLVLVSLQAGFNSVQPCRFKRRRWYIIFTYR